MFIDFRVKDVFARVCVSIRSLPFLFLGTFPGHHIMNARLFLVLECRSRAQLTVAHDVARPQEASDLTFVSSAPHGLEWSRRRLKWHGRVPSARFYLQVFISAGFAKTNCPKYVVPIFLEPGAHRKPTVAPKAFLHTPTWCHRSEDLLAKPSVCSLVQPGGNGDASILS